MVSWPNIIKKLQNGESVTINPKGQSMTPRIKSGEEVTIYPLSNKELELDMIVLSRVRGNVYLHKISAVEENRIQISNNHGHINGWTNRHKVFGWVDK